MLNQVIVDRWLCVAQALRIRNLIVGKAGT